MAKDEDINLEIDEINLEDLIVLGEHKKIPIHITYPKEDGTKVKAKAFIRQLTLKEMENVPVNTNNFVQLNLSVLGKAFFKGSGDSFTKKELSALPVGVVNAVSRKILDISGIELNNQLENF